MRPLLASLLLALLVGCGQQPPAPSLPSGASPTAGKAESLPEARRAFKTRLVRQVAQNEPAPEPPAALFRTVRYESPAGKMAAYLSQPPKDGKKHPAIVWVFGGFGNDIGDPAWSNFPASNDQSASAFRKAGIVMMYPSFRGGNDNPGFQETFLGEVDDLLAATDYLAKVDYVDPSRIYLGGHSTGGTLVLLAAAGTDRYRAVFSFGPVEDVAGYGADALPFMLTRPELDLRSPARWQNTIGSPTFVFEGSVQGNLDSLQALQRGCTNPLVHFYPMRGFTHFSILAPTTKLIASKIVADDGPQTNIAFTPKELDDLPRR